MSIWARVMNLLRGLVCPSEKSLHVEGGIYSIDNGDGNFRAMKILKIERNIVHVRVYKNKFPSRPDSIKLDQLSLGKVADTDGFGMGHLPVSKQEFAAWKAVLLTKSTVKAEELEGYRYWKEAGGGVFGQ